MDMSEGRNAAQRKADVIAALEKNRDLWLATADRSGKPHLIAASSWWDGASLVIATRVGSPTAKNLGSTGVARLAAGSPEDVVMIDVRVSQQVPVGEATSSMKAGFVKAVGWDPADEGNDWTFFVLTPLQIQAYRGYGELAGRNVMRNSRWLA
jgi:hypothetical protein